MQRMRIMPIVSVVARELRHGRQIMHAGQGDATDQRRARQSIRAPVGANHHRGQMPTGGMPAADDVARAILLHSLGLLLHRRNARRRRRCPRCNRALARTGVSGACAWR